MNRLKDLSLKHNTSPVARTGATEWSILRSRTVGWDYDRIFRLTNETFSLDTRGNNGSVSYVLDPGGNRKSQAVSQPQSSMLSSRIPSASFRYDPEDRSSSPPRTKDRNGN